jgi:hypothetical protein
VQPVPEETQSPDVGKGPAGIKDGGCYCREGLFGLGGGCGVCDACGCAKPWTLPQPCLLQNLGFKVGGWLEQGTTFNTHNVAFNGPVATNDWANEYQMNQLWLYLDRPAKTDGCGWAIGGHVDMIYGTDWRFGINHGLEDRINGFNFQHYGLVLPQFYLEVAYNDLSVKFGHMAAILDYEAVPSVMNPFYSHSYSYGYTVPQLVTGVLADYKVTDLFSVQAGVHRGWQMFEDNNHNADFMGGMKWASLDKRSSLAYAVSIGPQDPAGQQSRFVHSLVLQQQLSQRLRYVLVHNLGWENDGAPTGDDARWYGINQYLLYKLNRYWSLNMRVEWMRDDDGARIAGPGNIPGVYAFDGRGFAGDFYGITCGAIWRPHPNLMVRPEVRWDRFDGPPGLIGPAPGVAGLPFNNGLDSDQLTAAVDVIFTF